MPYQSIQACKRSSQSQNLGVGVLGWALVGVPSLCFLIGLATSSVESPEVNARSERSWKSDSLLPDAIDLMSVGAGPSGGRAGLGRDQAGRRRGITSRYIFPCRTRRLVLSYQRCAEGLRNSDLKHMHTSFSYPENSPLTCKHASFVTARTQIDSPPLLEPKTPGLSKKQRGALDNSWWSGFWLDKGDPTQTTKNEGDLTIRLCL